MAKLTVKEAFAKIKELLKFEDTNFTNAKCSDGTILQWTGDLKEGVALMVVGADGNQTPAPDATYAIEDGSAITTVGGLVTAIQVAPDSPDMPDQAGDLAKLKETTISLLEKFTGLTDIFAAFEEKFTAMDEKFTAIEKTVSDSTKDVNEKFEAIQNIVSEIAEEPAAPEIPKENRFKKTSTKTESIVERMAKWKKAKDKE